MLHPVPALTPQRAYVFAAHIPDLDTAALAETSPQIDDIVARRLVAPHRLKAMIAAGDITDGFTLAALGMFWAATHDSL